MITETSRFTIARTITIASHVTVVAVGATVPLLGGALDDFASSTRLVLSIASWSLWAAMLLAVLVPSPVALTASRLAAVAMLPVTTIATVVAPDGPAIVALALVVANVVLALSAEAGNRFVQASAYGSEKRFLLRCPRPLIVVQVLSATLWFGAAVVGTAAAVDGRWMLAVPSLVVAVVATALLPRRFHRLSRRWLVVVPAGLVVHDHVQLAETAMFATRQVRGVVASDEVGAALDLSGCPHRPGIAIELTELDTIVLAGDRRRPGGRAVHASLVRVCPTRRGWALAHLSND